MGKRGEFDDPGAYLEAAAGYVEKIFSGKREALRPIVPLYRKHVFPQIKPATQTRIDLGFALGPLKQEGPHHAPHPDCLAG